MVWWEVVIIFGGKFAVLFAAVTLALFLSLTFIFGLIDASNHLTGLGLREWVLLGAVVSILLIVFQRLAAWVYSL